MCTAQRQAVVLKSGIESAIGRSDGMDVVKFICIYVLAISSAVVGHIACSTLSVFSQKKLLTGSSFD